MYSLIAIYAIIPLIFSHFFWRFGENFLISNGIGNFESIKVEVFLLLMIFVIIETIFVISHEQWNAHKKTWGKIGIILMIFTGISQIIYPHESISRLLLGIGEKQHGILFVIGLVILAVILKILSQKNLRKLSYVIIGTGIYISGVAIIESFFGYNMFTGVSFKTTGSWGDVRSIATLGNPNYVAGYLIMILPMILGYIDRFEKYILVVILFIGILATKSVIGITLACAYILYTIISKIWKKNILIISLCVLIPIILYIYYSYHESDKWLSLTSRFILMKHVLLGYIQGSPLSIIFGNGPDSISGFFSGNRETEITAYFPRNMIIDSSHNIFVDILYSYGFIGIGTFVGYIAYSWKNMSHANRSVSILGLLFFSLNVIIIAPLLLLIFSLQGSRKNLEIPQK